MHNSTDCEGKNPGGRAAREPPQNAFVVPWRARLPASRRPLSEERCPMEGETLGEPPQNAPVVRCPGRAKLPLSRVCELRKSQILEGERPASHVLRTAQGIVFAMCIAAAQRELRPPRNAAVRIWAAQWTVRPLGGRALRGPPGAAASPRPPVFAGRELSRLGLAKCVGCNSLTLCSGCVFEK